MAPPTRSSDGAAQPTPPGTGDWNGDGKTDLGLFNPSDGSWRLDYNRDGTTNKIVRWGGSAHIPVTGDWNGS